MTVTSSLKSHGGAVALRVSYAAGNFGKSLIWTTYETLLLYYLIAFGGLSPWVAGGALTSTLVWDGCADLAIGYVADRCAKSGRLLRVTVAAAPFCGLSFALMFLAPSSPDSATIALAACIGCRMGYTVCDIAHNSLLVRVASCPTTAGGVSGLRLLFSALGAATVGAVARTLLALPRSGAQREAFGHAGVAAGIFYALTVTIAVAAASRLPGPPTPSIRRAGFFQALSGILRDIQLVRLLALIAMQAGLVPLIVKGLPFLTRNDGPDWAAQALFTYSVAQAVALLGWTALAGHISLYRLLALGHLLLLAGAGLLVVGCDGSFGLVAYFMAGVGVAGMNQAIWALLALRIRALQSAGESFGGLAMGVFLATLKIAAGLATGLLASVVALDAGARGALASICTLGAPLLGAIVSLTIIAGRRSAALDPRAR